MFLLFMGWFALVAKVFSVQVIQSKEYTELAEKQAMRRKILHPSRGEIHDRNGKKMAINAEVDVNYQEGNEKISRQLRRVLPFGHTAGQLIGNVGNEGYGQVGIEYSMDRTLRGEDGWEYMRITVQKKYHPDFKEQRREPVHGKTIVLSIDVELQKIAELALERGIQRVGAIA
jgi:cell division protein FtsI/penicillin-binding protein 2